MVDRGGKHCGPSRERDLIWAALMGTAKSVPTWAFEIEVMREFNWTEKQLFEEVSLLTLERIAVLFDLRKKAEKLQMRAK